MVWWWILFDNCFYVNKIKIDFLFDKFFKWIYGVIILDIYFKVLIFIGRKGSFMIEWWL